MDIRTRTTIVLCVVITSFYCPVVLGSSLRLESKFSPLNEVVHHDLNVTCIGDGSSFAARDVIMMKVSKDEQEELEPLAVMYLGGGVTLGPGAHSKITASGRIERNTKYAVLTVSMKNPDKSDGGHYTCHMAYIDWKYQVRHERANLNVTVDRPEMETVVNYLLDKMSSLENTNREQQKTIDEQNKKIADFINDANHANCRQENTNDFKTQIDTISNLVRDASNRQQDVSRAQNQKITALNLQADYLRDAMDSLNHSVNANSRHHDLALGELKVAQKALLSQVTDVMNKGNHTCAFSMAYHTRDSINQGSYMRFTNPVLNIGNAYDPSSGIFGAPIDGLYVFHLVIRMPGSSDYIYVYLRVNGQTSVAMLNSGDNETYDQSEVSTVVHLHRGDTIAPYIHSLSGTNDATGEYYSLFSGYLLQVL